MFIIANAAWPKKIAMAKIKNGKKRPGAKLTAAKTLVGVQQSADLPDSTPMLEFFIGLFVLIVVCRTML